MKGTTAIAPREYLLSGFLFILVGVGVFSGPALFGSGPGGSSGVPLWYVLAPFGTIFVAIGAFWLMSFGKIRRSDRKSAPPG